MQPTLQQENRKTIGSTFSNAAWAYRFLSSRAFIVAREVLRDNENSFKILRIDEESYEIELMEPFVGTLGKNKNFYKELRAHYQIQMIPLSEIKAKRTKCLGSEDLRYQEIYELL
jgi:hypothetical protein